MATDNIGMRVGAAGNQAAMVAGELATNADEAVDIYSNLLHAFYNIMEGFQVGITSAPSAAPINPTPQAAPAAPQGTFTVPQAQGAIEDAFRHSSLPLFGVLDVEHDDMRVQVTVAVQAPDAVDAEVLAAGLPRGRAEVRVGEGGLNVEAEGAGTIVIAQASVEAFLPRQTGWRLKAQGT